MSSSPSYQAEERERRANRTEPFELPMLREPNAEEVRRAIIGIAECNPVRFEAVRAQGGLVLRWWFRNAMCAAGCGAILRSNSRDSKCWACRHQESLPPHRTHCAWCEKPMPKGLRRDAVVCCERCRNARLDTGDVRKAYYHERYLRRKAAGKIRFKCDYCGKRLVSARMRKGTCNDTCTDRAGHVKRQNERRAA